jgi:hypothetical protein
MAGGRCGSGPAVIGWVGLRLGEGAAGFAFSAQGLQRKIRLGVVVRHLSWTQREQDMH